MGRRLLLLLRVVALLLEGRSGLSSAHSLRTFYTVVSEPSPGLPEFSAVGYVDDQPVTRYENRTRSMVPLTPWMSKLQKDYLWYWDEENLVLRDQEKWLRESLATLLNHIHLRNSTGFHTLQLMHSCKVGPDGQLGGGFWRYAYNGKDLLFLNTETPSWMPFVPQAEILKRKLPPHLADPQRCKLYLEGRCVDSLRKYLDYGNETLQRTEPPTGKVAQKKGSDGQDVLVCQLYGFCPKKINVTWMKDGEVWTPGTLTGGVVVPNSDGTYHTWFSINVDSKDRDHYRCRVIHDSLLEPLDLALKEPGSNEWPTVGDVILILCGVVLMAVAILFCICKRLREVGYKSARRDSGQVFPHPSVRSSNQESTISLTRDSSEAVDSYDNGNIGQVSSHPSVRDSNEVVDSYDNGDSSEAVDSYDDGDSGQVSSHPSVGDSGQESSHPSVGDSNRVSSHPSIGCSNQGPKIFLTRDSILEFDSYDNRDIGPVSSHPNVGDSDQGVDSYDNGDIGPVSSHPSVGDSNEVVDSYDNGDNYQGFDNYDSGDSNEAVDSYDDGDTSPIVPLPHHMEPHIYKTASLPMYRAKFARLSLPPLCGTFPPVEARNVPLLRPSPKFTQLNDQRRLFYTGSNVQKY